MIEPGAAILAALPAAPPAVPYSTVETDRLGIFSRLLHQSIPHTQRHTLTIAK